ncbi:hypothetical protein K402DRAFT_379641 [Aulographum hederae CBS 113979]|uniref:A to I editase domain-containing protein n=1 Tax=Aulographum hederae CBS 113979 TaxID=1176131 RepID=A0A6G1GX07_9PEZI|nr:hypothetical protein K402DRAFT_379641 [Aulographum hederae CBS 113979]
MPKVSDDIANCVFGAFNALPGKCKPRKRDDGTREWVPLSGIVLSTPSQNTKSEKPTRSLTCVAVATGMKCLPHSKLPRATGNVLHDWHAEILAIRAFNRFLLDECAALVASGLRSSAYVRWREDADGMNQAFQPFQIKEDVEIHMYCSEAPCGDASMELVMDSQNDATPWATPPLNNTSADPSANPDVRSALRGRGYFSELGVVRLKPSRSDSVPALSKSCSDKLALKQFTSLLSSTVSLLVLPSSAYLSTFTIPASQHNATAVTRCFGSKGRLSVISPSHSESWEGGYRFRPFLIRITSREFIHSRRSSPNPIPCNVTAVATPHFSSTLIGGVLQGRKQLDPRGATKVSRRSTWRAALEVAVSAGVPLVIEALKAESFKDMKSGESLNQRKEVKDDVRRLALRGWEENSGDENWSLEGEN